MVDVTHDRDDRRPRREVFLVLVGVELEVEARQDLGVLLLGRDDLDVVAELGAEQLQRLLRRRLRRGHHLAHLGEDDLDERGGVGADAVREVGQAGATRQPDDLALTARDLHAADRRGLHVVELLTPLLLRLPASRGSTTRTTSEGTLGGGATTTTAGTTRATAAESTATGAAGSAGTCSARTAGATGATAGTTGAKASAAATGATGTEAAATAAGTTGAAGTARTTGTAARCTAWAARATGHARSRQAGTWRHRAGRGRPRRHHAGRAGTRGARTRRHGAWRGLAGRERVVAGPGRAGTRGCRARHSRRRRRGGGGHLVVIVVADDGRLDLGEDLLDRRVQHGRRRSGCGLRLDRRSGRGRLLRGGLLRLGSGGAIRAAVRGRTVPGTRGLDLREGGEHLCYDGCFDRRRRCLDVLTVAVEPLNELF